MYFQEPGTHTGTFQGFCFEVVKKAEAMSTFGGQKCEEM